MILIVTYTILQLLLTILLFIKKDISNLHKKKLIKTHFLLLMILIIDLSFIHSKGVWTDRILFLAFLLSASAIFALYYRKLKTWPKLYFGFFLIYPIFAATTFFMDRLMFVLFASPFLIPLSVPETKYSDSHFEIREIVGAIAPVQFELLEKGLLTEKYLGMTNGEEIASIPIRGLTIILKTKDSTNSLIESEKKSYEVTFKK